MTLRSLPLLRRAAMVALSSSLFAVPAFTQVSIGPVPVPVPVPNPINNAGLQGDQFLRTAGGWVMPAAPAGNPFIPATGYLKRKIALGKALFWDEQVSTSNTMACGTCHIPARGGVDPRPPGKTTNSFGQLILGSNGVIPQAVPGTGTVDYGFIAPPSFKSDRLTTPIHVPTMIGAYVFNQQFWDLRAGPVFNDISGAVLFPNWASLENQAVGPPLSDIEMGHQNLVWSPVGAPNRLLEDKLNGAAPLALIVPGTLPASIPAAWLTSNYRRVFDSVFAADPNLSIAAPNGVTRERFAMALASYMRTLIPDQAPIDTNRMTRREEFGFDIFVNSGCGVCHSVSGFPQLVNTGGPSGTLVDPWDNSFSDGLPHNIFFTDPNRNIGSVKTPTLRNVGLRSRFFHDGLGRIVAGNPQNTLADIVDFYDIDQDPANGGPGGPFELRGAGPTLTPGERASVIAFLGNALTDPRVRNETFPFDRPKLFSELVPFGTNLTQPSTGTPAGWRPVMIANTPALVEKVGGPNWWKLGVGSAGGGSGAPIIPPGSTAILYLGVTDTAAGPFWLTRRRTDRDPLDDCAGVRNRATARCADARAHRRDVVLPVGRHRPDVHEHRVLRVRCRDPVLIGTAASAGSGISPRPKRRTSPISQTHLSIHTVPPRRRSRSVRPACKT